MPELRFLVFLCARALVLHEVGYIYSIRLLIILYVPEWVCWVVCARPPCLALPPSPPPSQGSCPECGAPVTGASLAPNVALRAVVAAFRRECSALAAMASAAGDVGPIPVVPGGSGSLDDGATRTWASTVCNAAVQPGQVGLSVWGSLCGAQCVGLTVWGSVCGAQCVGLSVWGSVCGARYCLAAALWFHAYIVLLSVV